MNDLLRVIIRMEENRHFSKLCNFFVCCPNFLVKSFQSTIIIISNTHNFVVITVKQKFSITLVQMSLKRLQAKTTKPRRDRNFSIVLKSPFNINYKKILKMISGKKSRIKWTISNRKHKIILKTFSGENYKTRSTISSRTPKRNAGCTTSCWPRTKRESEKSLKIISKSINLWKVLNLLRLMKSLCK